MANEKRKPTFWVEGHGAELVIIHIKCGERVDFNKVPYPGEDNPRVFHVLSCLNEKNNRLCMVSGGLYFHDDSLEEFKVDLNKLEKGQQIIVRRGPVVEAPTRTYKLSKQILEVFERR